MASKPVTPSVIGFPNQGTHTLGNWESDNAYDYAVPVGTPVYAEAAGTIGSQIGSLGTSGRFEGIRLHLVTAGNEFYYAHLSKLAPGITAGTTVKAGQLLGYTGSANGVAHLHIGMKNLTSNTTALASALFSGQAAPSTSSGPSGLEPAAAKLLGHVPVIGPLFTGAANSVDNVVAAVVTPAKLLTWMVENPKRLLEVFAGGVMLLVGVILMFRITTQTETVQSVGGAASSAASIAASPVKALGKAA